MKKRELLLFVSVEQKISGFYMTNLQLPYCPDTNAITIATKGEPDIDTILSCIKNLSHHIMPQLKLEDRGE